MAHKTLIGGTAYEVSGGKTLIGGTAYSIKGGRALIGGTGYDISFGASMITVQLKIPKTAKTKMIYVTEPQTISLTIPSSLQTYAALAASSEYNTYSPDSGGYIVFITTYEGCVAVEYGTSSSAQDRGVYMYLPFTAASSLSLYDGQTIDISPSATDFYIADHGIGWTLV